MRRPGRAAGGARKTGVTQPGRTHPAEEYEAVRRSGLFVTQPPALMSLKGIEQRSAPIGNSNMTKAARATKRGRGASPIYLDKDDQHEKPNVVYLRRRRRRIVFGWYGGKFSHLDWLLPLLPACHHYCEPFAGSGAVLLNRERPSLGGLSTVGERAAWASGEIPSGRSSASP